MADMVELTCGNSKPRRKARLALWFARDSERKHPININGIFKCRGVIECFHSCQVYGPDWSHRTGAVNYNVFTTNIIPHLGETLRQLGKWDFK